MSHQLLGCLLAFGGFAGLLIFMLLPGHRLSPLSHPEDPQMIDPKVIWNDAKALAAEAMSKAFAELPGEGLGPDREKLAVQYLLEHVEEVDQLLPVIGQYMDLPIVNTCEEVAVKEAVHATFQLLVRQQFAAHTITAAAEPVAPVPVPEPDSAPQGGAQ